MTVVAFFLAVFLIVFGVCSITTAWHDSAGWTAVGLGVFAAYLGLRVARSP